MSTPDTSAQSSGSPADRPRVTPGKGLEISPLAWLAAKVGATAMGTDDVRLFSTLGRVRRLFPAWLVYSGMMMPFGALSRRDTELVILRVAHLRGSTYERRHHEHLGAKVGLSAEEIERTTRDIATAGWPERNAAMLTAADEIVSTRDVSDATWDRCAAHLDERQLIALCMLVSQYDGLATTLHALRVQTDVRK